MSLITQQRNFLVGEDLHFITLKRSKKRTQTLTVRVDPQHGIIISVPWDTPEQRVQQFITCHKKWILQRLAHASTIPYFAFTAGEKIYYLGQQYPLHFNRGAVANGCSFINDVFHINIKGNITENLSREHVYLLIKKWFMYQASVFLKERLIYWQDITQITYNQLKINNPKKKWGCCYPNNDISINWRIMLASLDIIDYLLVHELCHVVHKNHSQKYWELVGKFIPDYKLKRQEMRQHPANYFHL